MIKPRPPIVTVLGHVDHGKTTLLDAIRKTRVAEREAGGITQGIGAVQIETPQGLVTFVDTPGHSTFSGMRARGAKIADIVLLIVAADDGVMPQTEEAISYIHENQIPTIVVVSKIDLPSANIEKALSQLEEKGIYLEGRGGQIPYVPVSAKQKSGIEELLEMISLMAGVNEIQADSEGELSGSVIETNRDKRGIVVSVVIKNGTLKVGDNVSANGISAKVKSLFDAEGKTLSNAVPGSAVAILGFSEIPLVGATVVRGSAVSAAQVDVAHIIKPKEGQLPLVVKSKTAGALEAIIASLPKEAAVVSSSVGEVSDSDIFSAKNTGAIVVTFELKTPNMVKKLAETENVDLQTFDVVYDLLKFVKEKIQEGQAVILGKAEILDEFSYDKKRVAGCKIIEGRIKKEDKLLLMRGDKEIGSAKIASMRREKNNLAEAKAGEECGILITPQLFFEKGDILLATK